MIVDSAERKKIDCLAEKIRNIIDPNFNNISLEEYLEKKGIEVRYFDDERFDAFLKWDREEKRPIIAVNAMAPRVRQRFSIAHELGHLILDWRWVPGVDNSDVIAELNQNEYLSAQYRGKENYTTDEQKQEQYANEFATAFLVPESALEKINDSNDNYDKVIEEIMLEFGGSEQAANIRLQNYLWRKTRG